MKEFSYKTREENIEKMQSQSFDLIIIGGGINGAGVARDAALRGMKVALVEAQDFAEGTSSRSSKLVHGGIRYLENFDFALVHEALQERQTLFDIAPNLCGPLEFLVPIFSSSRVGMFKMGVGMWLYDLLSAFDAPGLHSYLGKKEFLQECPTLKKENFKGGYAYYDGYMDDDRLAIETLRSAHNCTQGAAVAPFVKVEQLLFKNQRCEGVVCKDQLSGKSWSIKAKHVVSCLGPWSDLFFQHQIKDWQTCLRPTKGVHLTFSRKKIPLSKALVMALEERIIFVIPRNNYILVGTTDTDFFEDPNLAKVTKEDQDYLLKALNHYFPSLKIGEDDILGRYAGVRPLVLDSAEKEGKTSREHRIYQEAGITFVMGGKYTTYRKMAQQAVDLVLEDFCIEEKQRFGWGCSKISLHEECSLENYRRAQDQVENWSRKYNMPEKQMTELVRRHGGLAQELLEQGRGRWSYWECEAYYAVKYSMCFCVQDFFSRRTDVFLSHKDRGYSLIPEVLKIFADYLDWSSQQREEQITDFKKRLGATIS